MISKKRVIQVHLFTVLLKSQTMKKLFVLIIMLSAFACSEEDTKKTLALTFENFQTGLTSEMDYTAIVDAFGEPVKDIGSGIHIYVYELTDATEIWIGYVDDIHYAIHVDEDQTVLHTII